MCPLFCRQCAMAALRDVKLYLTEEAGQIAVSSGMGSGLWQLCQPQMSSAVPSLRKGSLGNQALVVLIEIFCF